MYILADSEILRRYRATYGLESHDEISLTHARQHLNLERRLTSRLLASEPDERALAFRECYDELYGSLPWLRESGGPVHQQQWVVAMGAPPQRIYEIGSGSGRLARALAALGYNVEATDIAAHRGGTRAAVARLSWSETDGVHLAAGAQAAPYDVVFSDQVVEHLHPDDLPAHLEGAFAILRPGGRYVVRTPHLHDGPHDISRVFGFPTAVGMHLREYTNVSLGDALKTAGFRRVRAGFTSSVIVGRMYFHFQRGLEMTIGRLEPDRRCRIAERLPRPVRLRLFLVADRP